MGELDQYFFLFLNESKCYGYLLEVSCRGASNEYHNTFSRINLIKSYGNNNALTVLNKCL